ncbi:hypothetical protein N806_20070 [Rhodococcus sp. P27]|nr:hypothetical protein N806_20070 [Rhodococcus sp. P27]
MSADQHLLVAEFHRAFGHPVALMPTWRDQKTRELRIRLLLEEYDELRAAEAANDRIEIADALADIAYIAHGTMWVHGLPYWANKTFDGTLDDAVEKYRNARTLIEHTSRSPSSRSRSGPTPTQRASRSLPCSPKFTHRT